MRDMGQTRVREHGCVAAPMLDHVTGGLRHSRKAKVSGGLTARMSSRSIGRAWQGRTRFVS